MELGGNSTKTDVPHRQGRNCQLRDVRQPFGNDAAMAFRVIALKAHQTGAARANQIGGSSNVA